MGAGTGGGRPYLLVEGCRARLGEMDDETEEVRAIPGLAP
jgi:hypothetical protein